MLKKLLRPIEISKMTHAYLMRAILVLAILGAAGIVAQGLDNMGRHVRIGLQDNAFILSQSVEYAGNKIHRGLFDEGVRRVNHIQMLNEINYRKALKKMKSLPKMKN